MIHSKHYKNSLLSYCTICTFAGLLVYSIFISYKSEVVDDHIEFLNAQIPRLKAENVALFRELKRATQNSKSNEKKVDKFIPFTEYLFENHNEYTIHKLEIINTYLMEYLAVPDFLPKTKFENLSLHYQEILGEYFYVQFQNSLLNYLWTEYGHISDFVLDRQFQIIDFWSKDKYEIHLNFIPKTSFETTMNINGMQRNENALLFGPTRSGLHIIDVSLTQFDAQGNERQFNFKKEVIVLP